MTHELRVFLSSGVDVALKFRRSYHVEGDLWDSPVFEVSLARNEVDIRVEEGFSCWLCVANCVYVRQGQLNSVTDDERNYGTGTSSGANSWKFLMYVPDASS